MEDIVPKFVSDFEIVEIILDIDDLEELLYCEETELPYSEEDA